ncbi:hypothetical protein AAEX28_06120 [Lentisphaerota bacterium WC36G]|nr:hypothetical protein LJT99_08980 [Lentisphaerae bacterium WC36]
MKIKKFKGKSLTAIRQTIYNRFGSDAVIISSKSNNFLHRHEVIVAYNHQKQQLEYDNVADEKLNDLLINIHDQWSSKIISKIEPVAGHSFDSDFFQQPMNLTNAFKQQNSNKFFVQQATNNLKDLLKIQRGIDFKKIRIQNSINEQIQIFTFVGATGVGKTTTLAKLAAKAVLEHNLNIGLITIDTYRVAAVDQLKEYAALLGVEMQVAFSGEEINRHLTYFGDKDIVFIDTPGRSPFDKEGLDDIAEQLGNSGQKDGQTFLIIPANIRKEESIELIDSYKKFNIDALIISKTDECNKCDGLSTLFDYSQLPVAYVSDGQSVPEDIHEANESLVSSLILNNYSALTNTDTIRIGVNGYE